MHSIKPGRGPSWGGVIGGVFGAIFGVFWTIAVTSAGGPSTLAFFGVVFALCGIGKAIYNFYNATSENRFSDFDITGPGEEIDPLTPTRKVDSPPTAYKEKPSFCPYCGTALQKDFEFCPQCGKDI
jgi:zinc-ribbon domain